MSPRPSDFPNLAPIPRLRDSDMIMVQVLLRRAGVLAHTHEPFGEDSVGLFVRVEDLEMVKQLLADFRTRDAKGNEIPIPW